MWHSLKWASTTKIQKKIGVQLEMGSMTKILKKQPT